jgi:Tetratricopeptide repeat
MSFTPWLALTALLLQSPPPPPAQHKPEATSLLGKPLYAARPSPDVFARSMAVLDQARAMSEKGQNADFIIWMGRAHGYWQQFRLAIATFSMGVRTFPSDARMYRHRGHRYITVREFDNAIADLSKAAELAMGKPDEIEPDGQPNARGIPTSTLKTNVYYHLGLAQYLKGDFQKALQAYRECLTFSKNPDMIVAASHWLYMTLRRLGRDAEAQRVLEPITAGMDIIENGSYHKLLLMYKGEVEADALLESAKAGGLDAVTIGYGVGNWHVYNKRRDRAMEIFRGIVENDAAQWPAFGYVAAEAELARK